MVQNIFHSVKVLSRCETRKLLRSCTFRRQVATAVNILSTPDCTMTVKKDIETHWKDQINSYKYISKDDADKFYVLSMFPYPSGALHMGHIRVYTISDTMARFYRMRGKRVIHPMGWDAFGLPAENAAAERNVDPAIWTNRNITTMQDQMRLMNYSFDWQREIATCDPDYFRWTQELFLRLYTRGLAYQKEAYVNWDPVDRTVLAEEQVDLNQRSWRSGVLVEKKLLKQWFIRTTAFAKDLWDGLSALRDWKDIVKMQEHWIGECNGVNMDFQLISEIPDFPRTINLWTDVPEFVEHAKFVAVSPSSALHRKEHTRNVDSGVSLLGDATAVNPFSGDELPIFVTDKIAYPPWRDARLGVPSASMDDLRFSESIGIPFTRHAIRSHEQRQQKRAEVMEKARRWRIGGYPVSPRLQDWLISRQRYWGTPIPVVHCERCGAQPVPRADLPVTLPTRYSTAASKGFSLREATSWLKTSCPACGGSATREPDTMDTFVDSSWYFLRFLDPDNTEEMFSVEKARQNFPVDLYIGGKEHAVLHLYYARFMSHFLYSEGLLPCREPFKQLLVQGVVMGKTYKIRSIGKYVPESEVMQEEDKYTTKQGEPVVVSWEKMSKSKHNGINPLDLLSKYGVDTTRLLILADVAPTSTRNWSENTVPGIRNWMNRLWTTVRQFRSERDNMTPEELTSEPNDPKFAEQDAYMFDSRNYFLKKVTFSIMQSQQFSIAISRMQGLTNSLRKVAGTECSRKSREFERALAVQIIMLAPFAPHFASELWANFCSVKHHLIDSNEVNLTTDVLQQKWPEVDMDYKLELNVFMNKRQYLKLKIPRRKLDEMTAEIALEHVILDPYYQKNAHNKNIIDVSFQSEKGCDASLYITMEKKTENTIAHNLVTRDKR